MNYKEIIPFKALRKFDAMCLHSPKLRQDRELQQQILNWAADMLLDAREEWGALHATTIDAVITEDRKSQAKKRGKARNNKYAPFREYFKNLQQQKFIEFKNAGIVLKASEFLRWFLENKTEEIVIPYKKSNQYHKLMGLAQENNREFKKYL